MIGGGIDAYNRDVQACRWCNRPRRAHSLGYECIGTQSGWTPPQDWLILARMRLRRTDPLRWIPWDDDRMYYRKWDGK